MNLHSKSSLVVGSHSNVTNQKRIVPLSETIQAGYTCGECHLVFKTEGEWNMHSLIHNRPMKSMRPGRPVRPKQQCDICKKIFGTPAKLQCHRRTHSGEKPYTCGICNKGFTEACNLKAHLRIHTGELHRECKICYKMFSSVNSLRRHMCTHTKEKPYNCEICQKSFSLRPSLAFHTCIHTGDKPYKL